MKFLRPIQQFFCNHDFKEIGRREDERVTLVILVCPKCKKESKHTVNWSA